MKKITQAVEQKPAIRVPTRHNKLLEEALIHINANEEIMAMWEMTNTNAMSRMGFSDHGVIHFQIVANIALKMCRILEAHKIAMGVVKDYGLTADHAELIVVLASLFHDLGMTINRHGHEEYSLFIASRIIDEVLAFMSVRERVIVRGETLHAIINHRDDGRPKTIEAGIMRIADALDMSGGRSRIPFEKGEVNIHSLSAYAIDSVELSEGDGPELIQIHVYMNNSSGLFQVDELLKEKIKDSGMEDLISVRAYVVGKTEKKLITEFVVKK
jgi:metal-dependent HD superfamily phosphatase/phosphodiesterase